MISFNCPYCANPFEVEQALAGKNINCPTCKGNIPVPGGILTPPTPNQDHVPGMMERGEDPDPAPPVAPPGHVQGMMSASQEITTIKASSQATMSLVFGLCSVIPCFGCLTSLPAMIFGLLSILKTDIDPGRSGTIKAKAFSGMGMGFAFPILWFILVSFSAEAEEERRIETDLQMEIAEEAFHEKDYETARPIYETYAKEGYDSEIKNRCNMNLGIIEFEEGREYKAKSKFRKVLKDDSDLEIDTENPKILKVFREIRIELLITRGEIFFPVTVEGSFQSRVIFSSWRIEGKRIYCDVKYPGEWSDWKITMDVYGPGNKVIDGYEFNHAPSKNADNIGYLCLEWDGKWDEIYKLGVKVTKK